ncbi:MAG TPA: hypothetical protein VK558_05110 [Patescibacteria group bacterium]|nr:hypothetical protein [Patescibacteria group bacterium]
MNRRSLDRLVKLEASIAMYQPNILTKAERDAIVKACLGNLEARHAAGEDIRAEIEAEIAADPNPERARAVFDALFPAWST